MNIYYKAMLRSIAAHFNVSLETPWKNLPDDFKKVLLHGSGEDRWILISGARAASTPSAARSRACCRTWNGCSPKAKASSSATASSPT
jgi:excinuclease UvrABC ATPase subunit